MNELPTIKPTRIERIVHPDGRVDVKVHVSRLEVQKILQGRREKQQPLEVDNGKRDL